MAENRLQHFLMHQLWLVVVAILLVAIAYYYFSWTAYQNDTQPYAEVSCGTPPAHKTGADVTFTAGNSYDVDEDKLTYIFEFSDGTIINTDKPQVTKSFSQDGVYTITLTVRDPYGKEDTHSCDFIIASQGHIKG